MLTSIAEREQTRHLVKMVKVKMVKIENGCCQNRHYNINILFIYSEQMTKVPKSILTILTLTTLTTQKDIFLWILS